MFDVENGFLLCRSLMFSPCASSSLNLLHFLLMSFPLLFSCAPSTSGTFFPDHFPLCRRQYSSFSSGLFFLRAEVQVEYEYDALHDDELTLRPGDIIRNVRHIEEEGWMEGELNGKRGLFPDNFVKVKGKIGFTFFFSD